MARNNDRVAPRRRRAAGLATGCLLSGLISQGVAGTPLEVTESAINAGGSPAGEAPASDSFRVTLDAIGDSVAGTAMSSGSYRIEGGLPSAFPPPGPVHNLRFESASKDLLSWDPEPSAGTYGVYRGLVGDLASATGPSPFGACLTTAIDPTAGDANLPNSGEAFFYLVTVANRLHEEGTKSVDGPAGTVERPFSCSDSCFCNSTCAAGCNP